MKKTWICVLGAMAAAGAAALLLGRKRDEEEPHGSGETHPAPPTAEEDTVAFPLKNKYADYSRGESDPIYRFELETPQGVREAVVSAEQYESCYIGDEVLCRETGRTLEVI